MLEIGGFFELELAKGNEYHDTKYKLNNGRNCVKYILKNKKYRKIYMPVYTCDSVKDCIEKLEIEIIEYNINERFEPQIDIEKIEENGCFLYVNYFGICGKQVRELGKKFENLKIDLIIDNTQAFFAKPEKEKYTIYSARKFFGVPDGGYLYSKVKLREIDNLDQRIWGKDALYLIQRIEEGATEAYSSFRQASKLHQNFDIERMSEISENILKSIDYTHAIDRRNSNFFSIHNEFKTINKLKVEEESIDGAMVYPLWIENGNLLRQKLINHKIYIAKYWEDVLKKENISNLEKDMVENIIAIPIDQRYGKDEMKYIIKLIKNNIG